MSVIYVIHLHSLHPQISPVVQAESDKLMLTHIRYHQVIAFSDHSGSACAKDETNAEHMAIYYPKMKKKIFLMKKKYIYNF